MQITARTSAIEKLRRLRLFRPSEEVAPIPIRRDPIKRGFDILFSSAVLVTLSPLLLAVGLCVKLTSPGPILFFSKRLGRGGKVIECVKFRTMFQDAEERLQDLLKTDEGLRLEWEVFQKFKQDPRITSIGKFLRKTSLDEMPQFWNVLKGDMSVVGPRPPTLMGAPDQYLQEIQLVYGEAAWKILTVRPGITGIWQISGRSKIPMEERRKLEANYAENRTFWKDLVVIAKTVPAVLFSRGAF